MTPLQLAFGTTPCTSLKARAISRSSFTPAAQACQQESVLTATATRDARITRGASSTARRATIARRARSIVSSSASTTRSGRSTARATSATSRTATAAITLRKRPNSPAGRSLLPLEPASPSPQAWVGVIACSGLHPPSALMKSSAQAVARFRLTTRFSRDAVYGYLFLRPGTILTVHRPINLLR